MCTSLAKIVVPAFAAALASLGASHAHAANVTINTLLNGPITDGLDATGDNAGVTPFLFLDSNQPGAIASVNSLTLNLSHTYAGDLFLTLRYLPAGFAISDPAAPFIDATLFDQINDGDFTLSNNLDGTYSFSNAATQTLQSAAQPDNDSATILPGTYLPSEFYLQGGSTVVVDLTAAFAGQMLSGGDFFLIFQDFYQGDAGTLNSASLNLTIAPEPASLAALGLAGCAMVRRRK